jgi:hypothetical protein
MEFGLFAVSFFVLFYTVIFNVFKTEEIGPNEFLPLKLVTQ